MSRLMLFGTVDGIIRGRETFGANLRPVAHRPQPRGHHDTPEEWWAAQADFYGRPVPLYPG